MKIAVLCSGGDAAGMNAAVWRLNVLAAARGWQSFGIPRGFAGLMAAKAEPLQVEHTARMARYGGTWLGVARVANFRDQLDSAVSGLAHFDALAVIGGNGSLAGAQALAERSGKPVVGLPATIDNDVAATDLSIGHDTAIAFGLEMTDRQRDTAEALPRLFCLETLGGPTGHLAAAIGRLAGADVILIPEAPLARSAVVGAVRPGIEAGCPTLIVASEGYPDLHGFLETISSEVGKRLRLSVLGHAQRGGVPTPRDRALAAAMAQTAIEAMANGRSGIAAVTAGSPHLVAFSQSGDAAPPDLAAWRGLL